MVGSALRLHDNGHRLPAESKLASVIVWEVSAFVMTQHTLYS
jgi:hypothetical protein